MKNTEFEKIIDILASLPEDTTENQLAGLEKSNNEITGISDTVKKSREAFSPDNHPDELLIAELILSELSGTSNDELSVKVSSHINNCFICNRSYQSLLLDLPQFQPVAEIVQEKELLPKRRIKRRIGIEAAKVKRILYYPVRVAAVFLIAAICLFAVSEITKPGYIRLGTVSIETEGITRTLTAEEYSSALILIDRGDYADAVNILQQEADLSPGAPGAFYTHYILGLLHLKLSKDSWLGLFPHYETSGLNHAAENLSSAIEKNTSGKYENVTYDASFYLAKTYILQQKYREAKDLLGYVISSRGSMAAESEKLLKELD